MKTLLHAIYAAVTLLLTVAAAQAADSAAMQGARSVAEMLQRNNEAQLRSQYVREGRLDDVRKLDEARTQRVQARREQDFTRLNAELARNAGVDGPSIESRALVCEPEAIRTKKPGAHADRQAQISGY